MRSAVLFYGQPRFFEKGLEYLKPNLLDINGQVDVFMHLWYSPDAVGSEHDASPWNLGHMDIEEPGAPDNIIRLFKPVRCLFERPRDFTPFKEYDTKGSLTPPRILFSMNYSRKTVCAMKREYEIANGFSYDWVAITRTDWALMAPVLFDGRDNKCLYLHNDVGTTGEYNDGLLFSNSANIDHFCTLYDKMDEYSSVQSVKMGGEALVGHHLREGGIDIRPESIKYGILRSYGIQMGACQ